ncbi:hypothetical protein B0T10DRAFT_52742 [Thelonectria olida]|uniref:Uncharacterized protein n=1 Tax=Thelonectria olida TaxID=1576542 RepID=A0A9P8W3R4_9HYPO|nr:hypothetical protein B0T10DRAFT_52742 [Thelonectria olida]
MPARPKPAPPKPAGTPGRPQPVPTLPIALIITIFFFAVDAMVGQANRSGYMELIDSIVDDEQPSFLPGTQRPLLKEYTGFPTLDRLFAMLNVFFANVADGSAPALSLFAFYFGTQMIPFFSILMVESQRVLKASSLFFNPVAWGFLMQTVGFGIIFPVFLVHHLLYTTKFTLPESVRLRDPSKLHAVVPAFLLGYILLSVLVAVPFPHAHMRQWCLAIWQAFPLYVVFLQAAFTGLLKRLSIGKNSFTPKAHIERAALSHAYGFAWNVAVTGQLFTIAVLATSAFFPGLYPDGVAEALSLEKMFIPGPPHSWEPMTSAASSFHDYLRYDLYLGSVAGIIWAVHLLSQVKPATTSEEQKDLGRGLLRSLLLSGPGGTMIALLQHRDDTVLAEELKAEKKH